MKQISKCANYGGSIWCANQIINMHDLAAIGDGVNSMRNFIQ